MNEAELLSLAVGLGLAISLAANEAARLPLGGLVVVGYLAFHAARPADVALTLAVALITLGALNLARRWALIFGRRRLVFTILLGFCLGWCAREGLVAAGLALREGMPQSSGVDLTVVGYVVPGLIALALDREGLFEGLCGLTVGVCLTRLALIVCAPIEVARWAGGAG